MSRLKQASPSCSVSVSILHISVFTINSRFRGKKCDSTYFHFYFKTSVKHRGFTWGQTDLHISVCIPLRGSTPRQRMCRHASESAVPLVSQSKILNRNRRQCEVKVGQNLHVRQSKHAWNRGAKPPPPKKKRWLIQNPVNGSKQGCKSQITRLVFKVEKKVPFLGRRSANRRWELPSTLPLFSTYADSPSADRLRCVSGQKRGDKRMILWTAKQNARWYRWRTFPEPVFRLQPWECISDQRWRHQEQGEMESYCGIWATLLIYYPLCWEMTTHLSEFPLQFFFFIFFLMIMFS